MTEAEVRRIVREEMMAASRSYDRSVALFAATSLPGISLNREASTVPCRQSGAGPN